MIQSTYAAKPKQFLDGRWDHGRVLGQFPTLFRMLGQHFSGPADQPGSGFVARSRYDGDVGQQEDEDPVARNAIRLISEMTRLTRRRVRTKR